MQNTVDNADNQETMWTVCWKELHTSWSSLTDMFDIFCSIEFRTSCILNQSLNTQTVLLCLLE